MINATGKRFVDEGADFRNYTYAKYGRVVLEQPGQFAWQVFDQKVKHLQRDEYRIRQVTKVTADTIEQLADKMAEYAPVNKPQFLDTVRAFNEAVQTDVPYNPTVKDGLRGRLRTLVHWTNWRMMVPSWPGQQERVARETGAGRPVQLFVTDFPRIEINHSVLVYAQKPARSKNGFERYLVYDPNHGEAPRELTWSAKDRAFGYQKDSDFVGGFVRVYQVYGKSFQ